MSTLKLRRRKGNAAVQVFALILVFTVTLLWIMLAQVYVPHVFPQAQAALSGHSEASNTFSILKTAWNNWPLIILGGLVLWVIVSSQKEEPIYGRGF